MYNYRQNSFQTEHFASTVTVHPANFSKFGLTDHTMEMCKIIESLYLWLLKNTSVISGSLSQNCTENTQYLHMAVTLVIS